jgi:hypothetical protein
MCEVCERKAKVGSVLAPFLAPGVKVEIAKKNEGYGSYEVLLLTRGGDYAELTADGDEGPSYFHWESHHA